MGDTFYFTIHLNIILFFNNSRRWYGIVIAGARQCLMIAHSRHWYHAIKPCLFLWNKIPDCHRISWGFYFESIPVF
jgi:hypothetical protein